MIFSLIFIAIAVLALHLFVMRSIDSYDGYGGVSAYREWKQFETKYNMYFENNNSSSL